MCNPVQFLSLLILKLSQLWPVGTSSNWSAGPFDLTPNNLIAFLLSVNNKIFKTYLVFPAQDLESAVFSRGPCVSNVLNYEIHYS